MRALLPVAVLLAACSSGNPDLGDTGTDPLIFSCEGDHDGAIDALEMEAVPGMSVPYLANATGSTAPVDVEGELVQGVTTWNLTEGPSAVHVEFDILDPSTQWWSSEFPTASHAVPLSAHDPDLLAIYASSDQAVHLLGLASRTESPSQGRTLLVYEEPVQMVRFPLTLGSSWTAESSFRDAEIYGVKNAGEESYAFEVDRSGTALLPGYAIEDTLRLRVDLSQTFAISTTEPTVTSIQYIWVRECLGELGRAISLPDEENPAFTEASELRRLDVGAD